MGDATAIFSIHDKKDYEIHEIVQQVYDALKEKGYNPVNQLVGYILSEDPTYITTYKGARSLTTVSYSQPSRALRRGFSSASAPSKRWMR